MQVFYYILRSGSNHYSIVEQDKKFMRKGEWKIWLPTFEKFSPICGIEYRTNSGKRRILYNEISSFEQFLGAIRILWDNKHDVQKPRGESGFRGGIVEIINLYNDRSYT